MNNGSDIDYTASPPVITFSPRYNAATDFIDAHLASPHADGIAYIDSGGACSYRELAGRVNRCGNALKRLGLGKGDRLLMILDDTIDFPTVFWGAIKAGIVPVPLNTLLSREDYRYIFADSGARALVADDHRIETLEPALADAPDLDLVVVAGSAVDDRPLLETLMAAAPADLTPCPAGPASVAFWLYSSGSTGRPKGVMHRHAALIQTAVLYGSGILDLGQTDRVYSAAKLFFAYGLGNSMSFPLHAGACAVLAEGRPTPEGVMAVIRDRQPTVFFGVPALYAAILARYGATPCPGHTLRICVSAGEALPSAIGSQWEEWTGVPILDGIGSTEMLHIFLSNREGDVVYGTSGKPVPGYAARLVDEDGADVATGDIGELLVHGPSSAAGYWNQPDRSSQVFQDGWTRTGDKYALDSGGYYHYHGRNDDMLKVSGQWVSPFEVEAALIRHPAVLEAGVVGRMDDKDLVKPAAYVVLKPGTPASGELAGEIQDFVKRQIAPHKYPRWIEFLEELPKTATGKIQRFKLRQRQGRH